MSKHNSKGQFAKGHIPWHKGKKFPEKSGGNSHLFRHGLRHTKFYSVWNEMKQRCSNSNDPNYPHYGGRGITVCKKWLEFTGFRDDMYKDYLKHRKSNTYTSIDRIHGDKGYCKSNCKWADSIEQNNHTRRNRIIIYKDRSLTLAQWERKVKIPAYLIKQRIDRDNWSIEKALTTQINKSI